MNIAFAGFRHSHIMVLYNKVLNDESICITGCYEENAKAKEEAEKKWGISFTYDTYEELLNDANADAVAIGDYYQKRGSMVISALEHGKHVICDKPICTDLVELEKIRQLSQEKNLQVSCMLELRYMSQVQKVKELIENDVIGKVHIVSFTGQHPLNYGSRPEWYFEKGKHGGTINDIGIHGIDLLRYITGKSVTDIHYARTWNAFADKEPQFLDCGQFSVSMEDIAVNADVSYAAPAFQGILPTYWSFYFWGTKGMLHFNLKDSNVIRLYRDKEEIIECVKPDTDYLHDFMNEIKGIHTMLDTEGVLESQKQILEIQKECH